MTAISLILCIFFRAVAGIVEDVAPRWLMIVLGICLGVSSCVFLYGFFRFIYLVMP